MSDAAENDVFEDGADHDELSNENMHDGMEDTGENPKSYKQITGPEFNGAPRGYMSKDDWTASGKDPKDWVSEEVYKERGVRITETAALKRDFDNQIKNLSLLHQVQLKNQRDELFSRRDDAIDIADKAAVKALDKQIKDLDDIERLNTPAPSPANAKAPEITEWESENPWCLNQNDPKTILANRVFSAALASGKTNAGALRAVDREIAAKFSERSGSPRQIAEGSRSAGGNRISAESVTMKTLSREEQKAWDSGLFSDEKAFLKAVVNDRKGAK